MKSLSSSAIFLLLAVGGARAAAPEQLPSGLGISVRGRPLTSHAPEVRGDRLYLPVAAVAHALGDRITVDAAARTVTVRRQTGIEADFSAMSGEVREGGTPILVSQTGALLFPTRPDLLQLPSEIVGALLGASVVIDRGAKEVRISRTGSQLAAPTTVARGLAELYEADYRYNTALAAESFGYGLQLQATGRVLDGQFASQASLMGDNQRVPFQLLRASVGWDRPNRQEFRLLDFSSSQDLQFLALPLRGGGLTLPLGPTGSVSTFVGATRSDAEDGPIDAEHYDTLATGWQTLFGLDRKTARPQTLYGGFGGLSFFGPERRGALLSGMTRYRGGPLELGADLGLGGFSGEQIGGTRVAGVALFSDVSARYRPISSLMFQSQFIHIGKRFLTPLAGGGQRPMTAVAGGLGWSPRNWLGTRLQGRFVDRLDPIGGHDAELTATLSLTPATPLPSVVASHTQGSTAELGAYAYTIANLTEEWGRYRFTADFTRSQYGNDSARLAGMAGATVRLTRIHQLQLVQSVASGGLYGGAFNWRGSPMLANRARLGAGFGYTHAGSGTTFFGRLMVQIKLPWQQSLQLDYQHNDFGYQLFAALEGPLYRAPRRPRDGGLAELAKLRDYGDIYGRVYQDTNLNGRFDAGVDIGTSGIQVQVDGTHFVETDSSGEYRARRVKVGAHTVRLNLETVRADLTLLDLISREVRVLPDRDVVLDFRVVRSGRIEGTVWVDSNENGRFDEGEEPLGDVRMVTATGQDTLTFADGSYLLADLPPGTHVLVLDSKTLPDDVEPLVGTRNVHVGAGSSVTNVDFSVRRVERGVQIQDFSDGANR